MDNKQKVLDCIEVRAGFNYATKKKKLLSCFKDIDEKQLDTILKELKAEGKIEVVRLVDRWNQFSGMGYTTPGEQ